jgi:hypothetical protein
LLCAYFIKKIVMRIVMYLPRPVVQEHALFHVLVGAVARSSAAELPRVVEAGQQGQKAAIGNSDKRKRIR